MKTNAIIEQVKSMESLYEDQSYFYKLTHACDVVPQAVTVQSSIAPNIMDLLIAFIQFEAADIMDDYGMSQEDVAHILNRFYECKEVNGELAEAHSIDLYVNWEKWCAVDVQSVKLFHRPGLGEALLEIIQKAELQQKYSESVDQFAVLMKDQLGVNYRKGHWNDCEADFLLEKIKAKAAELEQAIASGQPPEVVSAKAADLSNYSMMLEENYRLGVERARDANRGRELLNHLFDLCGIDGDEETRYDLWTRNGKTYTWVDERGEKEWNGNMYRLVHSDPDVAARVDESYTLILGQPLQLPPDAIIQQ